VLRNRRKFLRYYPKGFTDPGYLDLERGYKWLAHERWLASLGQPDFEQLLEAGEFSEVAHRAVSIEARTNLLFSFEKMALRDAVKSPAGARAFATALNSCTGRLRSSNALQDGAMVLQDCRAVKPACTLGQSSRCLALSPSRVYISFSSHL